MLHEAPIETEILREHLALVAFCAVSGTDDGMPRAPGRLVLTTRGIAWVAEIQDVHAQQYFTVTGLTLDGVIETANQLVASKCGPWVPMDPKRKH